MTHPLQQRRFRCISASALRASKKVQLSRTESRPRAFQRAIDEFRTLPLRVAQKATLSFKNRLSYISVIDETSDFKFGTQLGFAKTHHKTTPRGKMGVALG